MMTLVVVMMMAASDCSLPYEEPAFWVTRGQTPSYYLEGAKAGQVAGYWESGLIFNPCRLSFDKIPFVCQGVKQYFKLEDLCPDPRETEHWKKVLTAVSKGKKLGLKEVILEAACLREQPQLVDLIISKMVSDGALDNEDVDELEPAKVRQVLDTWTGMYIRTF
ncbi:MAG: hypothetical protein WC640_04005 [Candidatus Paceibacterota bacterium]|jgi:hypothetical protein